MKKLFFLITSVSIIIHISAQNTGDTIIVQTFIHDAYTDGNGNSTISLSSPRDTVGYFPNDPNLTFEKIIMSYNMRCKDNNSNNPGVIWFFSVGTVEITHTSLNQWYMESSIILLLL